MTAANQRAREGPDQDDDPFYDSSEMGNSLEIRTAKEDENCAFPPKTMEYVLRDSEAREQKEGDNKRRKVERRRI